MEIGSARAMKLLLVVVLVCGWTLSVSGAMPDDGAWSTAVNSGKWERNEPSANTENEPGAHAYNRSRRAAFTPQQLADALAKRFVCPATFLTQNYLNCSQTRYREWLLSCQKEDELDGVSASNQSVRLIARTAQLGLKCRHPVTCHWPVCQQHQIPRLFFMQEQSAEKARLFFQENVINNVNYVIGSDHNAICHQYTDASEIWKEIEQKYEILPGLEMMNNMALILGLHITQNRCIRSTPSPSEELIPTTSDFAQLTSDNLYEAYLNEMYQSYSNNESAIDETGLSKLLHDVGLFVDNESNAPTTTMTPSVSRRSIRAVATATSTFAAAYKLHRRSRRAADPITPNLNKCYDSSELMEIFDNDRTGNLNSSEFLQLFSYIVYQISHGNRCEIPDTKTDDYNRAEVYGYGTLAVFIISACSALGFVIIPMLPESVYEIMMTAFIALAFGTLTGDALLHMLPESLVDVDEGDPAEDQAFYKALVITFSIYLLFLFEGFTHLLVKDTHQHADEQSAHGHSHTPDHKFVKQHTHKVTKIELDEKIGGLEIIAVPSTDVLTPVEQEKKEEGEEEASTSSVNLQELILSEDQTPVCLGLTSLALVIIIGDAIHNVTDGISIGASFASDLKTGFSTSLAVLFHELPHEFGDFVILLTTGLTLKRALYWNFISSLSAFVGLYVGIAVGENQEADKWIFAVTSGMFLYVAIADMLPEMKNIKSRRPWIAFLAQNIGALFGIGFMIFMHYLEDLIHF